MKKISVILMALSIMMVSCGNAYEAQKVDCQTMEDSINYALGLVNGAQIAMYQFRNDSTHEMANDFLDGLVIGYKGKAKEQTDVERMASIMASNINDMREQGLAGKLEWQLREDVLYQGLVNALCGDTLVMTANTARDYFQDKYSQPIEEGTPLGLRAKKAKCMTKAKVITLADSMDSLNYAFGYLNGDGIGRQLVGMGDEKADDIAPKFASALNAAMNSSIKNPQIRMMGETIGKQIREQEEESGLIGIEGLATEFDFLLQGFINGLYGEMEENEMMECNMYVEKVINYLRFGKVQEEGEAFLAANALREEVTVTESGLQYEVLVAGKGKVHPTAESTVKVHYHGTLIDGTVFDSSVDRGEPISFPLNGVIAGWTEGVQLMTEGAKYRFYIPYQLGYGERGAGGQIPPYATLIFDVELLQIEK